MIEQLEQAIRKNFRIIKFNCKHDFSISEHIIAWHKLGLDRLITMLGSKLKQLMEQIFYSNTTSNSSKGLVVS